MNHEINLISFYAFAYGVCMAFIYAMLSTIPIELRNIKHFKQSLSKATVACLLGVFFVCTNIGCTSSQVSTVLQEISAYLPTVISLIGAFAPAETTQLALVENQTKVDLNMLEGLVNAVSPTATTWQDVQNVVNQLVQDGNNALDAALAIKDPTSQKLAAASMAALVAAIAIIDGYVTSAQTKSQVATKMNSRKALLKKVSAYWTPQQKHDVIQAYLGVAGGSDPVPRGLALAVGF